MSFTVVPLHNLDLPRGTCIPFGNGFVLQDTPGWIKVDKGTLADINRNDRNLVLDGKHALVAEYEAPSMGHPDPAWKGAKPKSIQELKFQSAMLASLAIWLRQPSIVCFTVCFHALSQIDCRSLDSPVIVCTRSHDALQCHPWDGYNPVTLNHIVKAGQLHATLSTIPRRNPVWQALRSFWAALTSYPADHRYPLFWMGLESLFGSDNTNWKVTKRLCDRMSLFLGESADAQQSLFAKVEACYNTRSEMIHGRWEDDPNIDQTMADTEAIVRTVVRHLLEKPGMLETFISADRDSFLEKMVARHRKESARPRKAL
jgi:hypothetical protein